LHGLRCFSKLRRLFCRCIKLIAGQRKVLTTFFGLTFLLGFLFVYLQAAEYIEAYQHMNLKLSTGIYGSTLFMLTGFHGSPYTGQALRFRSGRLVLALR